MEEVVALIFHGCKLVKDLEETLPNISNQPHFLISSCDEISRVFGNVREHLNLPPQDYGHHEPPHAIDMVLHEQLSLHQHHGMEAIANQELGGGQNAETDVAHSSLKQTRKRNYEVVRRRFRVPAPRMGNTEVPPEDGYSWRKYGQKEILGSKFPRYA
ncbi:putative transcription factor WRKY family [Helianthus debilis subsp. tardiflorus]